MLSLTLRCSHHCHVILSWIIQGCRMTLVTEGPEGGRVMLSHLQDLTRLRIWSAWEPIHRWEVRNQASLEAVSVKQHLHSCFFPHMYLHGWYNCFQTLLYHYAMWVKMAVIKIERLNFRVWKLIFCIWLHNIIILCTVVYNKHAIVGIYLFLICIVSFCLIFRLT